MKGSVIANLASTMCTPMREVRNVRKNIPPQTLLEGDYSAACRIHAECIARTLISAHSRITNFQLILQRHRRQLEFKQNNKFYLKFALRRLLPSPLILRQLKFEQNVRFYQNLAQCRMYPSARLQNKRRNLYFARCRFIAECLILD